MGQSLRDIPGNVCGEAKSPACPNDLAIGERSCDCCTICAAIRRIAFGLCGFLLIVAPVLDRFVFPEPYPGEQYSPPVGYEYGSELEGFRQRVLHREGDFVWIELTLLPGAKGPSKHIHTQFAEHFVVKKGEVSIEVGSEVVTLQAGEDFLVEPGTPHRPFNPNSEPAIVMGPQTEEFALPRGFDVFLTQAYGFFDEAPENSEAPRALLQMSRFSPRYDSWIAGPPIAAQKALYWVLGPIARALGYRSYYPRFAPYGVGFDL